MPQNSLEEKLKNPEMVYQTVDGKLYFREGENLAFMRKIQQKRKSIEKSVLFIW